MPKRKIRERDIGVSLAVRITDLVDNIAFRIVSPKLVKNKEIGQAGNLNLGFAFCLNRNWKGWCRPLRNHLDFGLL